MYAIIWCIRVHTNTHINTSNKYTRKRVRLEEIHVPLLIQHEIHAIQLKTPISRLKRRHLTRHRLKQLSQHLTHLPHHSTLPSFRIITLAPTQHIIQQSHSVALTERGLIDLETGVGEMGEQFILIGFDLVVVDVGTHGEESEHVGVEVDVEVAHGHDVGANVEFAKVKEERAGDVGWGMVCKGCRNALIVRVRVHSRPRPTLHDPLTNMSQVLTIIVIRIIVVILAILLVVLAIIITAIRIDILDDPTQPFLRVKDPNARRLVGDARLENELLALVDGEFEVALKVAGHFEQVIKG